MAIDTACVFPLKPLLLTLVTVFTHPYAFAQNANVLPDIAVNESPTPVQKYQLPATTESVTAAQLAETVNVTNTEDALKYLPS
jgi:iron complex outermembrane receptor protein